MSLFVKFNLILILVFAVALVPAAYLSNQLLQTNARTQVVQNARLMMQTALATRGYTNKQIKPLLAPRLAEEFLPQSVPAYSATEIFNNLRESNPEYTYKEATLNPTNPRDRAVDWEVDIVSQFRNNADVTEFIGQRDTPAGRSLYIARPIRITNPGCLPCHSTVDAAPRPMVDKYGPSNGYGWAMNEVIGAQIMSVPMDVPLKRADKAFGVFMTLIVAVFVAIGLALNIMLYALVIRPVSVLSGLADRVSLGELDAPEFATGGRDEIGVLADSFSRMRKSLQHAMSMLDA